MTNIGVLKEIKDHENRVGLTPAGALELYRRGHKIYVEAGAGVGSGFSDIEYWESGATICSFALEVVGQAEILVKVKEPVACEYPYLKLLHDQTLFAYLHLADNPELAKHLIEHEITGVSYDTIEDKNGDLPLLKPMSKIAGTFAVDFWEDDLIANKIKRVVVVGGGTTGEASIREALAQDVGDVVVYEQNKDRAAQLEQLFSKDPVDVISCLLLLPNAIRKADLVVGAVLVKGAKAPIVVTQPMLGTMKTGARIVDVSIDQGGCIHGSRPTTHSDPTYELDGKVYCCIPNMPGMRPQEATAALTEVTLPHLLEMADQGAICYLSQAQGLLKGINTTAGEVVNDTVYEALVSYDL